MYVYIFANVRAFLKAGGWGEAHLDMLFPNP
jgi:hypothetical protein